MLKNLLSLRFCWSLGLAKLIIVYGDTTNVIAIKETPNDLNLINVNYPTTGNLNSNQLQNQNFKPSEQSLNLHEVSSAGNIAIHSPNSQGSQPQQTQTQMLLQREDSLDTGLPGANTVSFTESDKSQKVTSKENSSSSAESEADEDYVTEVEIGKIANTAIRNAQIESSLDADLEKKKVDEAKGILADRFNDKSGIQVVGDDSEGNVILERRGKLYDVHADAPQKLDVESAVAALHSGIYEAFVVVGGVLLIMTILSYFLAPRDELSPYVRSYYRSNNFGYLDHEQRTQFEKVEIEAEKDPLVFSYYWRIMEADR